LIKIIIEFKEAKDGTMILSAGSEGVRPITVKEHVSYHEMSEKIIALVQALSDESDHSIYAEGESAEKLYNALEKKDKESDGGR
jgi:hypothetical protein